MIDHDEKLCPLQSQASPNEPSGGWVFYVSKSRKSYSICNPNTGKPMFLHKSLIEKFDNAVTGFGWDPISEVFKLIRIFDDAHYKFYYGTYLEVYDFETGQWKATKYAPWLFTQHRQEELEVRASWIKRFANRPNVYLNGFVHWMAYPYGRDGTMTIVSFDLHTEKFRRFPLPTGVILDPMASEFKSFHCGFGIPCDWRKFEHYLLVLRKRLSLVHHIGDQHVEVWVMKDYGLESSWEKKYIVRDIVSHSGDIIKGPYKPIKAMENGEMLLLCSEHNLGYYHPVTKVFRPADISDVKYNSPVSQKIASFR